MVSFAKSYSRWMATGPHSKGWNGYWLCRPRCLWITTICHAHVCVLGTVSCGYCDLYQLVKQYWYTKWSVSGLLMKSWIAKSLESMYYCPWHAAMASSCLQLWAFECWVPLSFTWTSWGLRLTVLIFPNDADIVVGTLLITIVLLEEGLWSLYMSTSAMLFEKLITRSVSG